MAAETVKKVWHITNYLKLFVATDAAGRVIGKVAYSQRPIYGTNEHTERYLQKIAALKQLLRFEQYVMSKHVFEELLDQSQKHHLSDKHLRGYILDEQLNPADSKRIAAFLEMDKKTTDRYLSCLAKVGLIELISMPKEEQMRSDVESCGSSSTSLSRTGKTLRVTGTGNTKFKYPTGKRKKEINPNPKGEGETDLQRQVEEMADKDRKKPEPEPEPEPEGQTSASPPTTPNAENPNPNPNPDDPTKPDGVGDKRLETISLARNAYAFAEAVYQRLGLTETANNSQASQIESWAARWRLAVVTGAATEKLLEWRAAILKRADKIRSLKANGRKTYLRPAAGLMAEAKKITGTK